MQDQLLMFSDAQAPTTGTTVSDKSVDLGAAVAIKGLALLGTESAETIVPDPGKGGDMKVLAQVTTTCTSGGSATVEVDLITSASADLSSPTVIAKTAAIAVATLVAGYQFRFGTIPPGIAQRYIGVQYVVATADLTAGKFTAGLVIDKQQAPSVNS